MDKQKEKKSGIIKKVLLTAVLTILFFVCGLLLGKVMKGRGSAATVTGATKSDKIVFCITSTISIFVSYVLTLIIHEGGHLIFGLATGYKFLSFRVFSLTLIKKDGKFMWKKFSLQGTGGQCILMPPESDTPEKVPFFLYHAGGGLMNLVTAAICLPIAVMVKSMVPMTIFMIFGLLSLFQGIINLMPMKIQVPNDGYNIFQMIKSPVTRAAIYKSLRMNGLLYYGYTPKEIPEELLDLGSEGFYSIVGKTLRAGVVLDRHDFETAEKLYEETAADSTIKLYQIESRCEVLFCKIMNGAPAGEIDELYDKELRTYINTYSKMMISKRRQMYAYQLLYKKDAEAAEKEYRAAMKMKETYPIEGELRSELELIEAVKERAERDNI